MRAIGFWCFITICISISMWGYSKVSVDSPIYDQVSLMSAVEHSQHTGKAWMAIFFGIFAIIIAIVLKEIADEEE